MVTLQDHLYCECRLHTKHKRVDKHWIFLLSTLRLLINQISKVFQKSTYFGILETKSVIFACPLQIQTIDFFILTPEPYLHYFIMTSETVKDNRITQNLSTVKDIMMTQNPSKPIKESILVFLMNHFQFRQA